MDVDPQTGIYTDRRRLSFLAATSSATIHTVRVVVIGSRAYCAFFALISTRLSLFFSSCGHHSATHNRNNSFLLNKKNPLFTTVAVSIFWSVVEKKLNLHKNLGVGGHLPKLGCALHWSRCSTSSECILRRLNWKLNFDIVQAKFRFSAYSFFNFPKILASWGFLRMRIEDRLGI